MIQFTGIFFMFISILALQHGFAINLLLWFLLGLFLVFSRGIFGHILFIERQKVRSRYRRKMGEKNE